MLDIYRTDLFEERGYKRSSCKHCDKAFWSLREKELCGECEGLGFVNNPLARGYELDELREMYLSFFEAKGHTRIGRYPVVARWRDDLMFTIASISCFQPWVLRGVVEPPANPLVISQPCLRFTDLEEVGKAPKYLTEFEMMAHHAFNTEESWVYFTHETVALCHEFLTKRLGVLEESIDYLESEWSGGGNSGPCFEVVCSGLEVATLVFMMFEDTPQGKREMRLKVVDTGYGLERLVWLAKGSQNIYEAIFPSLLDVIGQRNEAAYALCDHSRALVFMLNEGVVPSNVGEGYFARLLIRRSLRYSKHLGLEGVLEELVSKVIREYARSFPDFKENEAEILELLEVEEAKYKRSLERGRLVVRRLEAELLQRGIGRIEKEQLLRLYSSHGLTPDVVKELSSLEVEETLDFFEAQRIQPTATKALELPEDLLNLSTEECYYSNPQCKRFEARVLRVWGDWVVLDRTHFYPEGGGQESDRGRIGEANVSHVVKQGGVVLHRVDFTEGLREGSIVRCEIDWKRREALMRHHTATHIINAASREVLGKHCWQAGAHKGEELARLDLTHWEKPREDQLKLIEALANRIVEEKREVRISWLPRTEAERRYGFRIYQGGAPPGKELRIVEIEGFDAEACGGLHCTNTSEVGKVRIIGCKRIQDGVIRLEFKAGEAAMRYEGVVRRLVDQLNLGSEDELLEASKLYAVEMEELLSVVERFEVEAERFGRRVSELLATAKGLGLEVELEGLPELEERFKAAKGLERLRLLFELRKKGLRVARRLSERVEQSLLAMMLKRLTRRKRVVWVGSGVSSKVLRECCESLVERMPEGCVVVLASWLGGEFCFAVVSKDSKLEARRVAQKLTAAGGGFKGDERLAVGGGHVKDIEALRRIVRCSIKG